MREMNIRAYLLGTATETELTAIDRSLLTDDEVFEQILLAEDDLIEAYLQHQLSPVEQTQFEQFFLLDPERQQKLRLAQLLHRYANDPDKQRKKAAAMANRWRAVFRTHAMKIALAGTLFVIAVTIGLKTCFTPSPSHQIARNSPSPTTTIAPSTTGTEVKSVELIPVQTRANSSFPIKLSPDIGVVELKLALRATTPTNITAYEATLIPHEEAGEKLPGQFQAQIIKNAQVVLVRLPARALKNDGYRIKLEGVTPEGNQEVARYNFTVTR